MRLAERETAQLRLPGAPASRIQQLDVLRAVAILLVVGSHLTFHPALSRFGWTGVDLFFVLSGFLVSGLLFRDYKASGRVHWRRFIVRRGLKIYPAYYAMLVATVFGYYVAGTPITWSSLWPDAFFLQDYWPGTWGHLWSLGIEEQFYILLPFCLWLMTRTRGSQPFGLLTWLCVLMSVACLSLRAIQFYTVKPFDHYSHMRPAHLRFDALFFGVLLCYLKEFRPAALDRLLYGRGRFLLAISVVCVLPALLFEQRSAFMYIFGLSILYLGYGGILVYSLSRPPGGNLLVQALCRIGQSSYSIYLWHLPIAWLSISVLQDWAHWGRTPVFVTYVVACIAFGILMAQAIERPVLRLRERFFPDVSLQWLRLAAGRSGLRYQDVAEVPDHQSGVPVVDPSNQIRAVQEDAKPCEANGDNLGSSHREARAEMQQRSNERARLRDAELEPDQRGQQVQNLQV